MTVSAEAPSRPVLRYHGGKFRLRSWIVSHMPAHRTYVEPFGGAGSVLLAKPRSRFEIYNDLDCELVNLFRILRDRDGAAELERQLRLTPYAREEFAASRISADDPIEQARRTVVRCFMGFGTTAHNVTHKTGFRARFYKSGRGGGSHDWWSYPEVIQTLTARLNGVVVENKPALDLIPVHDSPTTLYYIDPPYPLDTRSSVRWPCEAKRCYTHELNDEDHRQLAELLHSVQGMVMLSGYACPLYDELYPDWFRASKSTFSDGSQPRTEILWLNPLAAKRTDQQLLFDDVQGGVDDEADSGSDVATGHEEETDRVPLPQTGKDLRSLNGHSGRRPGAADRARTDDLAPIGAAVRSKRGAR